MKKSILFAFAITLTALISCRQQTEIPSEIFAGNLDLTAAFADVDNTSITLEATLTVNADKYSEVGFLYGTNDTEIDNEVSGVTRNGTKFYATLNNLEPDTKYYFIAYANTLHIKLSAQKDFTTLPNAPLVDTCYISNIHAETATVNIETSGGDITEWGYYLSSKPDFEAEPTYHENGNIKSSFELKENLSGNTQYYFKAFIKNSKGTSESKIQSFKTSQKDAPDVSTGKIADIEAATASCNDNQITNLYGSGLRSCGLVWSTKPYPTLDECIGFSVETQSDNLFNGTLKGLTNSTTYYVRAYATNGNGTGYGNDEIFQTADDGIPYVTTDSIIELFATSATAQGNVTADGGHAVTARGMVWIKVSKDIEPSIENCDSMSQDQSGLGIFVSNLTNLSLGEEYYVRAYATNARGTAYGDLKRFMATGKYATVVTGAVSNVTSTTAIVSGSVTDRGYLDITERGFVWGTEEMPSLEQCAGHIPCGEGLGDFSLMLTDLQPETTYYVRAYAVNLRGTAYDSQQQSFTTAKAGDVEDYGTDSYEW